MMWKLLLVAILILNMSACSANDENVIPIKKPVPTIETTVPTVESTYKDTPAESLIHSDLQQALTEKNPYANLMGFETINSLTGDGEYEITLFVNAATQYANWNYEARLEYIKYDQGWMIDSAIWNKEEYKIVRTPALEEMVEIATQSLSERIDKESASYEYHDYNHALLPINNAYMEYDASVDAEKITLIWETDQILIGFTHRFTTSWIYHASLDNWVLENIKFSVADSPYL